MPERIDDRLVGIDAPLRQRTSRAVHEQQRGQQQRVSCQTPDARRARERVEQLADRPVGVLAHERVGLLRRLATLNPGDIAA
jgi:hypothetical protein